MTFFEIPLQDRCAVLDSGFAVLDTKVDGALAVGDLGCFNPPFMSQIKTMT